jgi:lipopolysaccharide-induced tumor necrosis factor-alpha factor
VIFSAINGVNAAQPLTPQQPILTAQHIVTTIVPLGPHSTHTVCPNCGCEINTKTRTSPGMIAWVSGFIIAMMGCWLGCCLIPCCIDECMDVSHVCPNCDTYLGRHRR